MVGSWDHQLIVKSFEDLNDVTSGVRVETSATNRIRHAKEEACGKTVKRIRKMVTAADIPSQSGSLARSLRGWVKFLMGMDSAATTFPKDPSEKEIGMCDDFRLKGGINFF